MKAYVNDIEAVAGRIGHQVTLFGNCIPSRSCRMAMTKSLWQRCDARQAPGRLGRGFIHGNRQPHNTAHAAGPCSALLAPRWAGAAIVNLT